MRADRLRLLDALEQIDLILQFAAHGKDAFLGDLLVQSALLHRLVLLGEACRAMSPELRDANPHIQWPQIIAFRNVVTHQYFGLDLELAWTIIERHVPELAKSLSAILDSLGEP